MGILGKFSNHIPSDLLEKNANAVKLAKVLDGMIDRKQVEIYKYEDRYDPSRTHTLETLRNFVDEFNGEYRPDSPRKVLECLYYNKWNIYGKKGTEYSLTTWLECVTLGTVTNVTFNPPCPIIHFASLDSGILPNGQDLQWELDNGQPDFKIPTLLDDTWGIYYTSAEITIDSPYISTDEFKDWVLTHIYKYLPVSDPNTTIVTINFT